MNAIPDYELAREWLGIASLCFRFCVYPRRRGWQECVSEPYDPSDPFAKDEESGYWRITNEVLVEKSVFDFLRTKHAAGYPVALTAARVRAIVRLGRLLLLYEGDPTEPMTASAARRNGDDQQDEGGPDR